MVARNELALGGWINGGFHREGARGNSGGLLAGRRLLVTSQYSRLPTAANVLRQPSCLHFFIVGALAGARSRSVYFAFGTGVAGGDPLHDRTRASGCASSLTLIFSVIFRHAKVVHVACSGTPGPPRPRARTAPPRCTLCSDAHIHHHRSAAPGPTPSPSLMPLHATTTRKRNGIRAAHQGAHAT